MQPRPCSDLSNIEHIKAMLAFIWFFLSVGYAFLHANPAVQKEVHSTQSPRERWEIFYLQACVSSGGAHLTFFAQYLTKIWSRYSNLIQSTF